ncbi:MAG: hypothetical protein U9R60_16320, partial [Bacteroidota bacterium]|nr:hypothetical protein [Bacteroidota bacterium]
MSENEGVTASVTIDFEAVCVGAENYLSAELDSDLNEGRSCFHYGEPAYFRVYRYPEDMVITLESSDGAITKVGKDYSKEYAENISFINTDQGQVSKLILL